jgi:PAS domain S-box-containing protein
MKALLAHSDPGVRVPLERDLGALGWEVTSMPAAAAWARFEAEPCRLVVASAEPAGLELCRRVHSSPHAGECYVVLVAPADVETLEQVVLAGADDYLPLAHSPEERMARLKLATRHATAPPTPPEAERLREQVHALQGTLGVQNALLEELFESTPLAVAVLDEDGRVSRINTEFTRTFGFTRAEVLGRSLDDLIVPEEEYPTAFAISLGVQQGERVEAEGVRCRKDGSRLHAAIIGAPVRIAGGQMGTYAIYRDITRAKRAEGRMRTQWELFHALAEHAPDIITRFDAEGRITYVSPAFERDTGIPGEHLIGRTPLEAPTSTTAKETIDTALRAVIATRTPQVAYFWGKGRSGEPRYYEVRIVPEVSAGGQVIGGVSIARDLTERELALARLEAQAAALEAEVEARSRFYAAMSHELRTPISAIMLYNELLLADTLGPLSAEQRDGVTRVQDAARRLFELVHDILDLARIEARKITVQPIEVSIPDEVESAAEAMRAMAESRGSELRVEYAPAVDHGCRIVTDPRRLQQILLNLLSNAIKFGEGRPIVVRCAPSGEPGGVAIEVIDQGIGISEADLGRIFEDFVQVGTHHEPGSGLGLALSRRLAELLGGTLEASSTLGEGSTFRLVLPAVTPGPSASASIER